MSIIIKKPAISTNTNYKFVDNIINTQTTFSNDIEDRLKIQQGESDENTDRRIGRKTTMVRFEFAAYYRVIPGISDIIVDTDISGGFLRHLFLWDLQAQEGLPVSEEIFAQGGFDGVAPLNMINSDRFILLYDRRFAVGNQPNRGIEELEIYVAQGPTQFVDEGIMDVTTVYKGGLETIWADENEDSIINGRLIEVDVYDHGLTGIEKDGWVRVWFDDH